MFVDSIIDSSFAWTADTTAVLTKTKQSLNCFVSVSFQFHFNGADSLSGNCKQPLNVQSGWMTVLTRVWSHAIGGDATAAAADAYFITQAVHAAGAPCRRSVSRFTSGRRYWLSARLSDAVTSPVSELSSFRPPGSRTVGFASRSALENSQRWRRRICSQRGQCALTWPGYLV